MTTGSAVDTLARTTWGEGRSCGALGMQAIINVICNRAASARWWGHDIISVCLDPWQFSCRNKGDINLLKLLAVTDADPWFAIALSLSNRAVTGGLMDITHGADSYFVKSMSHPPSWATRATRCYEDKWHAFYRVELPAPSGDAEAPCISAHSSALSDDLNDAELHRIKS